MVLVRVIILMMKITKYKGNFLEITEEDMEGHIYERVRLRSGVKVLPIKDNKILFIREFRVHEKESSIKLISGWMDKDGKTSLEIAKDELAEEAGFQTDKWEEFHCMNTDNFTVENKISYFIAENIEPLVKKIENPDHDIVEEILWLTESEFWEMADKKEINWFSDNFVAAMLYRKINQK